MVYYHECNSAFFVYFSRQQQGGGGGHDAGVVHAGQQEERTHQKTEPALSAVCILKTNILCAGMFNLWPPCAGRAVSYFILMANYYKLEPSGLHLHMFVFLYFCVH